MANPNIYKEEPYPIESTQITTPIKATSPMSDRFKIEKYEFADGQNKNMNEKVELKNGYVFGKREKPKSGYKYNLFSVLDEAVNTNCASCGNNEIIATKKKSNWE